MNRDEIIQFVFSDPEKRLERFCKSLVGGEGDWDELRSIVIERLCSLPAHQVEDMWQQKDGYRSQAIWIWLHNCAKRQAFGKRTMYEKTVKNPKMQREDAEFFDTEYEPETLESRIAFENKLSEVHEKFEQRAAGFTKLQRIVLETYLKGDMNASQICRASGVPYNFYLSKLDEIRQVMMECAGIKYTKEVKAIFVHSSYTRCPNFIRIAKTYKRLQDVPHVHLMIGRFQRRERQLYPQATLFPIKQYLPPLYRKIAIA